MATMKASETLIPIRAAAVQAAASALGNMAYSDIAQKSMIGTDTYRPEQTMPSHRLIELSSRIAMYIRHGVWEDAE